MRSFVWVVLLLLGTGCGIKKVEEKPEVQVTNEPEAQPSSIVSLRFDRLWDPDDRNTPNAVSSVKLMLAAQYFASHSEEFLAPSVVGSTAILAPGGVGGLVAAISWNERYPVAARELAEKWKEGIKVIARTGGTSLDSSVNMTGVSSRLFVSRIRSLPDDELRRRFDLYLTRVESEIIRNGGAITGLERGGPHATVPIATYHYETPERKGTMRTVVVRQAGEADTEVKSLLESATPAMKEEHVKSMLASGNGPFLVVLVREQQK